jgi:signal transduction histidine kinase
MPAHDGFLDPGGVSLVGSMPAVSTSATGLTAGTEEHLHERALAERISRIRAILAGANFLVLLLDSSIPFPRTPELVGGAMAAAMLFLAYALTIRASLLRRWLPLRTYQVASAGLDVLMAAMLILSTDGYLSPFNLWLVFAVVASGFSAIHWLSPTTTLLGLTAHVTIALVPQHLPIDLAVFSVRSGYLFGFSAVIAGVGMLMTRQSAWISTLERMGRGLSDALTERETREAYERAIREVVRPDEIAIHAGDHLPPIGSGWVGVPIGMPGEGFGHLMLRRRQPVTGDELHLLSIINDRYASAQRKARLSRELLDAAAREERLRMADELHDSYLQTLAAIDLHAEAARIKAKAQRSSVEDLEAIKEIARDGAAKARAFINQEKPMAAHGPKVLQEILDLRWPGAPPLEVEGEVRLGEGQWRALEALLREGLNNARRHSKSTCVRFRIVAEPERVCAILDADGTPPPERPTLGYGLSRVKGVVEANGGRMRLHLGEMGGPRLEVLFGGGAA